MVFYRGLVLCFFNGTVLAIIAPGRFVQPNWNCMNPEQKQDQAIIISVKKEWDDLCESFHTVKGQSITQYYTQYHKDTHLSDLTNQCVKQMQLFLALARLYRKAYGVDYSALRCKKGNIICLVLLIVIVLSVLPMLLRQ